MPRRKALIAGATGVVAIHTIARASNPVSVHW